MSVEQTYTEPVKFSALSINSYGCGPDDEDDVYSVAFFRKLCESGGFIDYDGYGYPVRDGKANCSVIVKPSKLGEIPSDATHIVWYNR